MSILLRSDDRDEQSGNSDGNSSPLAQYAAEHWAAHAQFEHVSSFLRTSMESLFDLNKPYFAAWLKLYDIDTRATADSTFFLFAPGNRCGASPLYYAALCGFQDLVECLIVKYPQHVNASGGCYLTPLVVALARKHFQTAELLRHSGADPNVQCYKENTPLHSAAHYGDVEMVQVLLDLGADVNVRNERGETPLYYTAVDDGYIEVVRVLLEHGANVGAEDMEGRTPFSLAKKYGCDGIMKLLSEHGAE
jgi:hypothetical protein